MLLVWPIRGSALTRRLDLVLVQREAQRLGVQLALLTQDPDVIRHARELNLSTFATVGASERGRWKRGRARLLLPGHSQDSETSDTSARDSAVARAQTARRRPAPVLRLTGAFILLLFVLALGAGAVLLILPTATITLLPARSLVETEALITANPDATNIDLEGAVIPAIRLSITVEESASLPPGGSQQLSSTPASGHVVFVNLATRPSRFRPGRWWEPVAQNPSGFALWREARWKQPPAIKSNSPLRLQRTMQVRAATWTVASSTLCAVSWRRT